MPYKDPDKAREASRKGQRLYRQRHPERVNPPSHKFDVKKYSQTEKGKIASRRKMLKWVYGISLETYNEMFQRQSGKCSICGKHQSELDHCLCVDHDHKTGKIRELLCRKCNLLVGNCLESIELLNNTKLYLEKYITPE